MSARHCEVRICECPRGQVDDTRKSAGIASLGAFLGSSTNFVRRGVAVALSLHGVHALTRVLVW